MKEIGKFGISRVDSKKGHYWLVRLNHVNGKPQIQKMFTDFSYGSKDASLNAAVKFRDENISNHNLRKNKWLGGLEGAGKEKHKDKTVRKEWKQERLRRRLKAIDIYGRRKVFVGTGIEGAKKARELGACNVTCWKIKSGQQDDYLISNVMPGYDMSWKGHKNNKNGDIEKQKQNGKKRIVLGVGRDAAVKAQELGASQSVCLRIFKGVQDSFKCCSTLPHFEVNGFKRTIPKEISDKVYALASIYDRALDIAAEVLINYSSKNGIPPDEHFLKCLVSKYAKIIRFRDRGSRKDISLVGVNGDNEEYNLTDKKIYFDYLNDKQRELH